MRNFFPGLIITSAIAFSSCSGTDRGNPPADVLTDSSKFTTVQWLDTLVDFGTVNKGEKVHVKFRCKNTGTHPLYITFVRPSCGCTIADYTKKAIPPGEMGEVNAEFDSQKAPSTVVRKTLTVSANTLNESPRLVFTGEVKDVSAGTNSFKATDSSTHK